MKHRTKDKILQQFTLLVVVKALTKKSDQYSEISQPGLFFFFLNSCLPDMYNCLYRSLACKKSSGGKGVLSSQTASTIAHIQLCVAVRTELALYTHRFTPLPTCSECGWKLTADHYKADV